MRTASIERNTLETKIKLSLNIDGCGSKNIKTDIPFFKHMLEQFAAHGYFDIDLDVISLDGDIHHTVEDAAIVLGQAFKDALGDKKGIKRYGNAVIPMDEALVMCAVDLSGRAYCNTDLDIKEEKTGDFDSILVKHFMTSFAANSLSTLHLKSLYGEDTHHIIEAAFKAFARALKTACEIDAEHKDIMPSTKGIL